ncbi:MAG: aspartate aminotransferase family protein [Acidimicrobiales bacterium]|nr:aspartate aminotransferase family protein [Acidimicrobiales bacterium]
MPAMHEWDASTELFAHSVIGYAIERLRLPKDPRWGAQPAGVLHEVFGRTIVPDGLGAHEAMRIVREVLIPSCRPMDDPMNLAYVPTAPTVAATMFDLVVSASSIFGGNWEAGAGAIAAENQVLRWLASLAGLPDAAGGVFVSGGSAANLSALVTARQRHVDRHGRRGRLAFAATTEVHASVRATARVMDVDVVSVRCDDHDRMTGGALAAALDAAARERPELDVFAVAASAGTTNAGAIDRLDEIAAVCRERDLWLHADGAYGLAALCSPDGRRRLAGIEQVDSFGVDPHKWLFAPYDCAALVYRDPAIAARTHSQHGDYLDAVDRSESNPSDYAYHLSRRARGLPLWFSLATYGTEAYEAAMDRTLQTARAFADAVDAHPAFDLLLEPELSIVLFRRRGWSVEEHHTWSRLRAKDGTALVVPTKFHGETVMRVCLVNPRTALDQLVPLLDDMATFSTATGFPLSP